MELKQDIARLMGSLFGKDTEKLFNDYYDDNHPEELLKACKDMLVKLLGPEVAHKHCLEMTKKHPEIRKLKAVIEE